MVIRNISSLAPELKPSDFIIEPWDISYGEFVDHQFFKKRNNLLPLAFVFQEVTEELFEALIKEKSLIKINGHCGVFKYKGEPNFLAFDDSFEAIDTFMDYYLLAYKDKGIEEIYTPVLKDDSDLINRLKSAGYQSWSDWQPDYLYYVYTPEI